MEIETLREKIDEIDNQICRLLKRGWAPSGK